MKTLISDYRELYEIFEHTKNKREKCLKMTSLVDPSMIEANPSASGLLSVKTYKNQNS